MIQRNWLIGKHIVETELTNRKDDYGKSVIKELSKKLTLKYGKGFDERNLYFFTAIYLKFLNILNTASSKSFLNWAHYMILIQSEDSPARKWYENEASKDIKVRIKVQ